MKERLIAMQFRLSRLDIEKRKRLITYLPKEEETFVSKLPNLSGIDSLPFPSRAALLEKIHPSWTKKQHNMTSSVATHYMEDYLLEDLELPLPWQLRSKEPLDFLLDLSSEITVKIIRLLGLYDVSLEMKKIIYSHQIKKIESAFSQEEIGFLSEIRKNRHPVAFIEIGLWNWDGDVENLHDIIFSRGMNRLAKALSDAGNTFLWYLAHHMPKEEGTKLLRFHKPLEEKKIIDILIKQVETAYVYIQAHQG